MTKKKENLLIFYIVSLTWGIAWTLIGAVIFIGHILIYAKEVKLSIHRGRIAAAIPSLAYGVSLGICIIGDNDTILSHEWGHTKQSQWFGILFPFIVAIPSGIRFTFWDFFYNRHYKKYKKPLLYDDVWFEGQATKLGETYE